MIRCKNAINHEAWYVECKRLSPYFDYNSFVVGKLMGENLGKLLKFMDYVNYKYWNMEK